MFKLYFITSSYVSEFKKKKLNFNFYKKRKIKVIILNSSPIVNPLYFKFFKKKILKNSLVLKKNNIQNFISKIKPIDKVISLDYPTGINEFIFKSLEKQKINYSFFFFGNLPVIKKKSILEYFDILIKYNLKILKAFIENPKELINLFWTIINPKKINLTPQYIFYSGKALYLNYKKIFLKSKFINIPTLDFDEFINYNRERKKTKVKKSNSATYISGIYKNSDQAFSRAKKFSDEKVIKSNYYSSITSFLKNFNRVTNLDIIVLKHPSEKIYKNPYKFGKMYSDTFEYVKNSSFVIAQSSTAIAFAILFKKPILFLNSNNFNYNTNRQIRIFANYFKKKPFNVSTDKFNLERFNEENKINHGLYKSFEKDYLLHKKEKLTSYEKIFNIISK